ncbi:hypothetical protein WR25_20740 [Diploscapter pachys]|uniref:Uncharacterized protein n=1 Tax=Diploscapter pachys TaxID=2018661 RepID=A0A2A2JUD6_9BILA|nr:hypothetical protein WR25_20740 [Diploscapter pachys]
MPSKKKTDSKATIRYNTRSQTAKKRSRSATGTTAAPANARKKTKQPAGGKKKATPAAAQKAEPDDQQQDIPVVPQPRRRSFVQAAIRLIQTEMDDVLKIADQLQLTVPKDQCDVRGFLLEYLDEKCSDESKERRTVRRTSALDSDDEQNPIDGLTDDTTADGSEADEVPPLDDDMDDVDTQTALEQVHEVQNGSTGIDGRELHFHRRSLTCFIPDTALTWTSRPTRRLRHR